MADVEGHADPGAEERLTVRSAGRLRMLQTRRPGNALLSAAIVEG